MAGKQASYVDSLPPDVRKRYDSKTACIKCDPYCIATTEWGKDVSKWPLIGFLDVINYLVHRRFHVYQHVTSFSHMRGALVGRRTTAAGFHMQNMCDV